MSYLDEYNFGSCLQVIRNISLDENVSQLNKQYMLLETLVS